MRERPLALQGGFTLIELIISAVIGLLVLMAVSYAFVGGRHAYVLNSEMMRMQEDARAALEAIRRDMRMAAFHGCSELAQVEDASGMPGFSHLKDGFQVQNGSPDTEAPSKMADENPAPALEIYGARANSAEANVLEEFVPADGGAITVEGGKLASQLVAAAPGRVLVSDCTGGLVMNFSGASVPDTPGASGSVKVSGGGGSRHLFVRGAQVFLYPPPRAFFVGKPDDLGTWPEDAGSLRYHDGGIAAAGAGLDDSDVLVRGVEAFRVCVMDETLGVNRLVRWQDASDAVRQKATQAQIDLVLISSRDKVLPEAAKYDMKLCGEADPDRAISYTRTDRRFRRLFSASVAIRNKITDVDKGGESHDSLAD
ncbi:MAG: prepilin-type N-terminal cleavage/methylation domain-containing protein [Zoogloeaceae bacterium]|nr:prepilin-type N-terminal cleavage/methylation domain-containing protein [Zoogloeaceae bacterium]